MEQPGHVSSHEVAVPITAPDRAGDILHCEAILYALAEAQSIEEVKKIHDHADAVRAYVRSASMGLDLQNRAAEIKLRAERKAGKMLSEMRLRGGRQRSKLHRVTLTLSDLGITKQQSRRWQLEASLSDGDFENYVRDCNESHQELTAAGLLRRATQASRQSDPASKRNSPLQAIAAGLIELAARGQRYACVHATPPWADKCRGGSFVSFSFSELARLPICHVAERNSHMHLWVPAKWLPHGVRLMEAWGFRYRGVCAIAKAIPEYGEHWQEVLDFLVLGVRGQRPFSDNGIPNLVYANRRGAELETALDLIERVSPGPHLHVFGDRQKEGWTVITG